MVREKVRIDASHAGGSTHGFDQRHVLYSKLRPNLNKVVLPDEPGIATTELVPLTPDPERCHRGYLAHYLLSPKFVNWAVGRTAGAKMPRLSMSELWAHEVPLPRDVAEQKRIAAIFDKADAIRRKRQQAIQLTDEFLRSVFLEMFGDPQANSKGFDVGQLSDVANQITDGAHHTPKRQSSGIPLLSARNVLMGKVDFSNIDFVGQDEFERLARRCRPEIGDLLISCSGSIGRVAEVKTERKFVLVRSAALVKLDRERVTSRFMEFQLRSKALQAQMARASRSSSQANLFQGQIKGLKVLLPPINLQREFDLKCASISKVMARQQASSEHVLDLTRSLQLMAFEKMDSHQNSHTTHQPINPHA